jgi:4-amino-4-deoxy-L-arabinose transferase-like glycosyltransferase
MASRMGRTTAGAALLAVAAAVAQLFVASDWSLLADEAYYWVWAQQPAWGYYDQPPLVAWAIAATASLCGDSEWALRGGPALAGAGAAIALLPFARDKWLWVMWWATIPALSWLTLFATPDAWLLFFWALGLAGALAGGVGWWLAGAAAGLAVLSKHSAVLLLPLLFIGAGRKELRTPHPWIGAGFAALLVLPHLVWLFHHDWITLRFQLGEVVASHNPPGWWGPAAQLGAQLGVVTPIAFLAATLWMGQAAARMMRRQADRVEWICWWTSAPVLGIFVVLSTTAPPEAHWPAIAWVSAGLGLSRQAPLHTRGAWLGVWFALFCQLGLVAHTVRPLIAIHPNPASRLHAGPVVARWAASWALPERVSIGEPGAIDAVPVVTERYQEAAWIHYYTGLEAVKLAGCGRTDHYDQSDRPWPAKTLFVRPARSGLTSCADQRYETHGRWDHRGVGPSGEVLGHWQLFELEESP